MRKRTQWQHNLTDSQIDEIFIREMTITGLDFRKDDLPLQVDGRTHYVRCSNRSAKNKNNKSGWYCAHYGVYPKVSFGWLHGKKPTYQFNLYEYLKDRGHTQRKELTEEEIAQQEQDRLKQIRLREIQEIEQYKFSRALTIIEYVRSLPLHSNLQYLVDKKIRIEECPDNVRRYNQNNYTPQELRAILKEHYPEYNTESNIRKLIDYQIEYIPYRGDNILIVGQTLEDNFAMFQLIFNKKSKKGKNKHFPRNTVKHKTFTLLGEPLNENTQEVIICEGWATGMSIHRFHPHKTILIAWDSGNMVAVAMQIRAKYKKCKIYSANDNDHTKPDDDNAGMVGGEKLASVVGAYLIPPPFDSSDPKQEHWSDWNDIELNMPFDVALHLFNKAVQDSTFKAAQYDPETMFDLLYDDETLDELNESFDYLVSIPPLTEGLAINTLGLHFVFDSFEKYVEAFHSSVDLSLIQPHKSQSLDEYKYDRKFIAAAMQFQTELMLSNKPLLTESTLFKSMFDHVFAYNQTLTNIDLIPIIHGIIASKYGEDLAKSSLIYFGTELGFYRDQYKFINALIPEISQCNFALNLEQDILFNVLFSINEYDFWQYSSRTQRELKAVEFLLDAFAKIEINTISQV